MVDNVFAAAGWWIPTLTTEDRVVVELNSRITADQRVDVAVLGVSDGITVVHLKR